MSQELETANKNIIKLKSMIDEKEHKINKLLKEIEERNADFRSVTYCYRKSRDTRSSSENNVTLLLSLSI